MRKLNQKRYETHSHLKRFFAWENSTKNMRKRRYGYHDHNDSFWVRKLIQKHHLEGCRAESGFGPYQSWIRVTCFGYSNSEVPRVYDGIWRVYNSIGRCPWPGNHTALFTAMFVESLLQEKVSDSRNPVWLLKDGSHKILAVVALVSDVRMTQRDRARGAGDGRQCFTPVNHWKLTDLVALSSILYRFRRLRRLNP